MLKEVTLPNERCSVDGGFTAQSSFTSSTLSAAAVPHLFCQVPAASFVAKRVMIRVSVVILIVEWLPDKRI